MRVLANGCTTGAHLEEGTEATIHSPFRSFNSALSEIAGPWPGFVFVGSVAKKLPA